MLGMGRSSLAEQAGMRAGQSLRLKKANFLWRGPNPMLRFSTLAQRWAGPMLRQATSVLRRATSVLRRPSPMLRRTTLVLRRATSVLRQAGPVLRRSGPSEFYHLQGRSGAAQQEKCPTLGQWCLAVSRSGALQHGSRPPQHESGPKQGGSGQAQGESTFGTPPSVRTMAQSRMLSHVR